MKYKITIETPEETFVMHSNYLDSISRYANAVVDCMERDLIVQPDLGESDDGDRQ